MQENKAKLLQEQVRIREILGRQGTADGNGEFPGEFKPNYEELGSEQGENAQEVEQFQNNLSVTQDLESKLTKIESALQRIESGTYGKCLQGDDIEEERLRVLPEADLCMKHAS
ncbi:MAG TPA: TraR/DksA C4-type zinc finger protein [Coxiellaceae bacterium]|nr:TraR/DksA C4-type zinc finger protein [Coxiellaceae bacterium]